MCVLNRTAQNIRQAGVHSAAPAFPGLFLPFPKAAQQFSCQPGAGFDVPPRLWIVPILDRQQILGELKIGSPEPGNLTVSAKCSPSKENKRQETVHRPGKEALSTGSVAWKRRGCSTAFSHLEAPGF